MERRFSIRAKKNPAPARSSVATGMRMKVWRLPDEVEGGNLVGKELQPEEGERDADDPPGLKRVDSRRRCDHARACQKSQSRHSRIDVEPGSKAGARDHGDKLVGGEIHSPIRCSRGCRRSGRNCRQQPYRVDEEMLGRDLPDHTEPLRAASRGGAIEITAPIDTHIANGISAVALASEIVQVGVGPSAVRRT